MNSSIARFVVVRNSRLQHSTITFAEAVVYGSYMLQAGVPEFDPATFAVDAVIFDRRRLLGLLSKHFP